MLPASSPGQPYDRKAAVYDALVGSAWYNRLIWGTDHRRYAAFARAALGAAAGRHIDAGCGSLVGTWPAYVENARGSAPRPSLLIDASRGMLERARERLGAPLPPNVTLLQADLRLVPLRSQAIDSALCMGFLHLFETGTANAVLSRIREALVPGGALYLTSLTLGRPRGDRFLRFLRRAGEVATPRTREAAAALIQDAGFEISDVRSTGNMLYVTAARR